MLRIGIDVGGTNTDAVALDGAEVIAAVKASTTADVMSGIIAALEKLLQDDQIVPGNIAGVMIGTTHFTNAVVEVAPSLGKVGVIRIGLPATQGVQPFANWPEKLIRAIKGPVHLIHGGYEFDGRPIAEFDTTAVKLAAEDYRNSGVAAMAISAVFSPMNAAQETEAAVLIREIMGEIPITLSHEVGGIGLMERENAAILNAALVPMAEKISHAFQESVRACGIEAPVLISQNDGTMMKLTEAKKFPVRTFASGPTNSMRGAAFLSQETDCIVVDVGGTTADYGVLRNGFPRQSAVNAMIGGVRTNLRMPDVLSIGLGGGSIVRQNPDEPTVGIGPDSVGYRIRTEAMIFGGEILTTTDIAVAAGRTIVGDPILLKDKIRPELCQQAVDEIDRLCAEGLDQMKSSAQEVPVIVVGGGGVIFSDSIVGASQVIRPNHAAVANAVGAAIGKVGASIDYISTNADRDISINTAQSQAIQAAISAGAIPDTVEIVEIEDVQLSYLDAGTSRIKIRAVGDLAIKETYHA